MPPRTAAQAADAFLAGTWEQQPAVFKATPERRAFFEGLASFSQLAHVARICEGEGEPLEFGEGVCPWKVAGAIRAWPPVGKQAGLAVPLLWGQRPELPDTALWQQGDFCAAAMDSYSAAAACGHTPSSAAFARASLLPRRGRERSSVRGWQAGDAQRRGGGGRVGHARPAGEPSSLLCLDDHQLG